MQTEAQTTISRPPLPVRAELDSSRVAGLADCGHYALARVVRGDPGGEWSAGDRLLTPLARGDTGDCAVDPSRCLRVPATCSDFAALLLPPTMAALGAWAELRLELGEVALYCGATPLATLLGRAAQWHGALPVIALGDGVGVPSGIAAVTVTDAPRAVARIRELAGAKPGFAAVDLSGRSLSADILLQALPRWGRLRLAGSHLEPLTIDFYHDVHLKGAQLYTAPLDVATAFAAPASHGALLLRGARLLQRPAIYAELSALFGA